MDNHCSGTHEGHASATLTRRSLLLGGCAGFTSLLLAPLWREGGCCAYAVDASNPTFKVFVVSAKEIGVCVVDVTGDANAPLPGASVTLTKRSDSSVVEQGTTDEDGNVIFNIERLADVVKIDGSDETCYRFDGSVRIVRDGYRDCEIRRIRCEGGSGMKVPTRKVTDNVPYFKSMSFDEWDIQYSKCEFYRVKSLGTKHEIQGEILAADRSKATVRFVAVDDATQEESTVRSFDVAFRNGAASFSLSDKFLCPGEDACLKTNATYVFYVEFQNSEQYRFMTGLSVLRGAVDSLSSGGESLMPTALDSDSMPLASIPSDGVPQWLAGSFTCWCPSFNVKFWLTPLGYFLLGYGRDWGATNSSPLTDASGWEKESSQSAKQQVEELRERWGKAFDKCRQAGVIGSGSAGKKYDFSSKLQADLALQAYALISYDWGKDTWTGTLNALAQASLSLSISVSTTIGPVPVFVDFNPSLSCMFGASFGVTMKTPKSLSDVKFTPQGTVGFTLNIALPVTLGVGVSGVLSAGLRGTGYLTNYFSFFELAGAQAGYTMPRYVLSGGIMVEIALQALLYKWSSVLWQVAWPRLYDSWEDKDASLVTGVRDDSILRGSPGLSLGSAGDGSPLYAHEGAIGETGVGLSAFSADAIIVTESELDKTSEVQATQRVGVSAPSVTFRAPASVGGGVYVSEMNEYGTENGLRLGETYEYEYVGHDEDAFCGGFVGVEGIGEHGGIKPTIDTRIARDIFSNPLEKTALFHSVPFMFRIISVRYKVGGETKVRTRLSGQRYDSVAGKWERPQVIDVPISGDGFDRLDTFDYDFDVTTQSESLSSQSVPNGIHVLLVSGTRPKGDQSSFADVASSPVMTWLVLDEYLHLTMSYTWVDSAGATGAYHSLSVPRITPLPYVDGDRTTAFGVAAAFLRHSGASASDLFSGSSTTTAELVLLSGKNLVQCGGISVNPAAYDLSLSANTGEASDGKVDLSLSVISRSKGGVRVSTASMLVARDLGGKNVDAIGRDDVTVSFVENVGDTENVTNMQAWPDHSGFLTVRDGVLFASTFDPKVAHGALSTRQVGPSNHQMSTFKVSPNGNVLFFLENRDGVEGQTFDEDFNPSPVETSVHRIFACLLEGGLFSEPFPLAETKHALDSLMAVNGGKTYSFLTSCITDFGTSSADLYYVDVPVVATATPTAFMARNQFVAQGEMDAPFLLELRNDGNVILKGCTLQLCDADTGLAVDTREFYFTRSNTLASVWNPELAEDPDPEVLERISRIYPAECLAAAGAHDGVHLLADPVSNDVLLPGKTAQYEARFSIPQDWHGTKRVYLQLSNYIYDTVVSATGSGDDVPVVTYTDPQGLALVSEVPVHEEAGDETFDLFDPGVWRVGADGSLIPVGGEGSDGADGGQHGGIGGSQGGAGGSQGGSGGSKIPAAGDPSLLSAAGLLAGAAVAGLAAYSARRVANERADKGDERTGS